MKPIISAIICTFNRANYLRKALQSLTEQTLDISQYEILVVDNRSTDQTKQVVKEEFAHIPNLRYVYEPIQGLSQARNTGWQNAKGEYVAYLDDDAIAYPKWLEAIVEAFANTDLKPGVVGGKVEPIWEVPRPRWLSDRLLPFLTVIDWSDRPMILNEKHYIAGANMAFPARLLHELGGFSTSLGRKGNCLLSNEELQLQKRIASLGHSILYVPDVCVRHCVPSKRVAQSYFRQRKFWQGVSNVILNMEDNPLSWSSRIKSAVSISKEIIKNHRVLIANLEKNGLDDCDIFDKQIFYYERLGRVFGYLGIYRWLR